MKTLDQYVRENKRFIKIKSGETFVGWYDGYAITLDTFNPEKEVVVYRLKDEENGVSKSWSNRQAAVAEAMSKIEKGQKIKITRAGSGTKDTKYTIEVIS